MTETLNLGTGRLHLCEVRKATEGYWIRVIRDVGAANMSASKPKGFNIGGWFRMNAIGLTNRKELAK